MEEEVETWRGNLTAIFRFLGKFIDEPTFPADIKICRHALTQAAE